MPIATTLERKGGGGEVGVETSNDPKEVQE
jgi:hypothetical protein